MQSSRNGTPPPSGEGQSGRRPHSAAELYREHAQQVKRWAARLAGPTLEADDIVQDVFMIAHRQLDRFRGDARVTTWLFGITNNVVRHRRRKERVRNVLLGKLKDQPEAPSGPAPIEAALRREARATVYRALDGLDEKYRTPFVMFEIEGLSGNEICELTGLNPATLRVRLMRARKKFQERLRGMGVEGQA